jgi:pyridoxamine 5'-phosphate oxidase
MRASYSSHGLSEDEVAADPIDQFAAWFADVAVGGLPEPNAMVLGTASPAGVPSARTVLLKGYDRQGFVFFTNYGSRKAQEIAANPAVSLLFPWHAVRRQVVVLGTAHQVSPADSAAYFRSRPRDSQLGAWASVQSSVILSREWLDDRYAALAARWPAGVDVPVPDFWGGFLVVPLSVEFWQGRASRLHDRLRYRRNDPASAEWTLERLSP